MIEKGLSEAIKNLIPVYLTLASGDKIEIKFEDVNINYPTVPNGTIGVKNYKIYPSECRQRAATYKGKINAKINWSINGRKQESLEKSLGEVPIMIKVRFSFFILF
jgi:DNA-directed RNA polymerase I subunit RPA2